MTAFVDVLTIAVMAALLSTVGLALHVGSAPLAVLIVAGCGYAYALLWATRRERSDLERRASLLGERLRESRHDISQVSACYHELCQELGMRAGLLTESYHAHALRVARATPTTEDLPCPPVRQVVSRDQSRAYIEAKVEQLTEALLEEGVVSAAAIFDAEVPTPEAPTPASEVTSSHRRRRRR